MSKLFTAIIRDRLWYWADLNGKLNESQFGFRQGRRTTDALFIMTSAIQVSKKKKTPLYTCFVDFAKAFDSVNHNLLWKKLASMGLSTKMLNILRSMYGKATSTVSANNAHSASFPCRKGVRQGCNLSPLLFSLFINDLETYLTSNRSGSFTLSSLQTHLLLFADDLVLLADSHSGLQDSMNRLSEFCKASELRVNTEKTKVVVFNKKKQEPQLSLSDTKVEFTKEYKYLGIILAENGSLRPAISTLASQASKALFSLMKTASRLSFPKPSLLCYMFDSPVRPVAEYGSEIWGHIHAEEVEIIHRRFCKFALGVPRSTTNLSCYGELGRTPMLIKRKVLMVKYWLRITVEWDAPDLVKDAYKMAKNSCIATMDNLHQTDTG